MRPLILLVLVGTGVLLLAGCVSFVTPVQPPQGWLITTYKAPLSTDFNATPVCEKKGMASTWYVRDILFTGLSFGWGEAGIDDAARNGHLETVHYADYEILSVLGIVGHFTVIARGN